MARGRHHAHDEPEPPGRARDRLEARNDYEINRKAEEEYGIAGLKSCATYEALTKIVETLAAKMNGNAQG